MNNNQQQNPVISALNIGVNFLNGNDCYQETLEMATEIFVPLTQLANNQITFDDFLDCTELFIPSMDEYLDYIEINLTSL